MLSSLVKCDYIKKLLEEADEIVSLFWKRKHFVKKFVSSFKLGSVVF